MAGDGVILPPDLIANGALQRTLALIDGFAAMVDMDNDVCAVPLLRLQIDTVLRLLAAAKFPDSAKLLEAMLAGTPLHRLRAPEGRVLTDQYLCELAAPHFPWLPWAYTKTSGAVHLSGPAVLSGVAEDETGGPLASTIGRASRRRWSAAERVAAVELFIKATEAIGSLVEDWARTKEARAARGERP